MMCTGVARYSPGRAKPFISQKDTSPPIYTTHISFATHAYTHTRAAAACNHQSPPIRTGTNRTQLLPIDTGKQSGSRQAASGKVLKFGHTHAGACECCECCRPAGVRDGPRWAGGGSCPDRRTGAAAGCPLLPLDPLLARRLCRDAHGATHLHSSLERREWSLSYYHFLHPSPPFPETEWRVPCTTGGPRMSRRCSWRSLWACSCPSRRAYRRSGSSRKQCTRSRTSHGPCPGARNTLRPPSSGPATARPRTTRKYA